MEIHENIRGLYEKFPYPHYPLLAKLNWNESHLNASDLALSLAKLHYNIKHIPTHKTDPKNILIAGCGEALPYISRKVEPWDNPMIAVDLSRHSIRRAKFRTALSLGKIEYINQDLVEYLQDKHCPEISHMEAFGVLHHMPSICSFLKILEQKSLQTSTMRVMVYNNHARDWIHHIQKLLRSLKIRFDHPNASLLITKVLNFICEHNSYLRDKIASMGASILNNPTRLIDNFLHCFELRWHYPRWAEEIEKINFEIFSFYDRYDELDHLPNPMWNPPKASVLNELAQTGEYQGNFEFWAIKTNKDLPKRNHFSKKRPSQPSPIKPHKSFAYLRRKLKIALRLTHDIPLSLQNLAKEYEVPVHFCNLIWQEHLKYVYAINSDSKIYLDAFANKHQIDSEFLQRLARKAFVFPDQFKDSSFQDLLNKPISSRKKIDLVSNPTSKQTSQLERFELEVVVKKWLCYMNQNLNKKELNLVLQRLSSILQFENKS